MDYILWCEEEYSMQIYNVWIMLGLQLNPIIRSYNLPNHSKLTVNQWFRLCKIYWAINWKILQTLLKWWCYNLSAGSNFFPTDKRITAVRSIFLSLTSSLKHIGKLCERDYQYNHDFASFIFCSIKVTPTLPRLEIMDS